MAAPLTRLADAAPSTGTGEAWRRPATWLSRQPPSFVGTLLAEARHRLVDTGDVVVPVHDVDCGVIGVVAGSVDIRLRSRGGASRLLSVRQAEYWCGRCRVLGLTPPSMEIVAREAVQLVYVPAEQVRRVVLEHPAAASAFADLVDEQATWLTTMLDAAMQRRAVARVARKLLAELGTDECGLLRLTQDELAEMTTLSRNTINRVLAEFEDAGAIVAGYGRLAIADRARLRRAAGLAADEPRSPAETR